MASDMSGGSAAANIRDGALARLGLMSDAAAELAAKALDEAASKGLEAVRLVFPDQHGVLRGKTILAGALASAFRSGVTAPSTILLKDTSQRTAFPVWRADAGFGRGALTGSGDILLAPDPSTFRPLPWSPASAWMLCDVAQTDGAPIDFAPRTVLRRAIEALGQAGYRMVAGLEVEFHVFRVTNPKAAAAEGGMPASAPEVELLTRDYGLLGDARYDALEPVMDALRRAAVGLGLPLRGVEAEFGPSQLEFVFDPSGPMEQADAMALFRAMTKQVCARQGLHATFMCKPKLENCASSGWHLHQSLVEAASGRNAFAPDTQGGLTTTASAWIAGLLDHARESCVMTTPSVNGYRRFAAYQLAPNRIQWAEDNRGAMIRALTRPDDPASRIENRVAEPAANPYYALASQIFGGLSGLERGLSAPAPVEEPYDAEAALLPTNLLDAVIAFENGALFRERLGDAFVSYYACLRRAEWERFIGTMSDWEQREYFSLY